MKELHTVYDISQASPLQFHDLFPLFFVIIGVVLIFQSRTEIIKPKNARVLQLEERLAEMGIKFRHIRMAFAIFFTCVAAMISLVFISSPLKNSSVGKKMLQSGNVKIVEGKIENFHPMPAEGHDEESFDVNGVHFEYGDYDETDFGYNNAASHGGAAAQGLYVRITYSQGHYRNEILKFETE